MRVRRRRSALLVAPLIVTAACHRPVAAPSPVAPAEACTVGDSVGWSRDTVRVVLPDLVDARHAPAPTNDAERLVFRQLYEGLVRVDCEGRVRPSLAVAWRSSGDTVWTFELAPDARFWDGTPVDDGAIGDGWRGAPFVPVRDVRSDGAGTVTIVLNAPRAIEAFADPAWSVVKHIPESRWPLGTGAWWVRGGERDGRDSVLVAGRTPTAPPGLPVLVFAHAGDGDPRDLLDGPVDVLTTRDVGVRRYAEARAQWQVLPLAWDRLYVVLSPRRQRPGATPQLTPDIRVALARDAVRADARPATPAPAWWARQDCAIGASDHRRAAGPMVDSSAVVFAASDPVAGDLAGRLVARADEELRTLLAGSAPGTPRAIGLASPADSLRLRDGAALAFVVALPAHPLDPCRAIAGLTTAVPWLADSTGGIPADAPASLVETRRHLVMRVGTVARLDADGGVRLGPSRQP